LGLAYKKNVDDCRESPSIDLIDQLKAIGATVSYADPHVPLFHVGHHNHQIYNMKSVELTGESVASFDAVILATAHDDFDYEMIKKYAKLIIDTRGVYYSDNLPNVVKA
jgi:UDP-N-acetyl-D-glucosamine dehydrogenase